MMKLMRIALSLALMLGLLSSCATSHGVGNHSGIEKAKREQAKRLREFNP